MVKGSFEGHKRASDFLPSITKWGDRTKVANIAGEDVLIERIEEWGSVGNPAFESRPSLAIGMTLSTGDKVWCIISQEVLFRKLQQLRDHLPFVAKFFKPKGKRYYDVK